MKKYIKYELLNLYVHKQYNLDNIFLYKENQGLKKFGQRNFLNAKDRIQAFSKFTIKKLSESLELNLVLTHNIDN